jgi:DNA-binding CsgD family transcriptional regulator
MTATDPFTDRERAVVELLLAAKTNKQIACTLGVSVRTVEFHLSRIYSKLGVTSRAEAIIRLTGNHRRESTVAETRSLPQDPSRSYTPRRIPVRTLAYVSAISMTSLLVVFLLSNDTSLRPQALSTPLALSHQPGLAPPTSTAAPTHAPPLEDFLPPPQSIRSSSGVTIEVTDLAFGPSCLRLQVLVHGLPAPDVYPIEDNTFTPFSAIDLYDPSTGSPLLLTQLGGGGGGGIADDGTLYLGQEAVYDFSPPAIEGPIYLTLRIAADATLGFPEPPLFRLQALPSTDETCGLQGSLGP